MLLVLTSISTARLFADDKKYLERQTNLIAKLLVSCRAIIAQNQNLINDPEKGDKGFTGEIYINKVKAHFKTATGVDVSENDTYSTNPVKKSLGVLLRSTKAVIDESQKVIN